MMSKPPLRSRQQTTIDAPLEAVWAYSMDLSKIPDFHPRVFQVDLLTGTANRGAGVAYQCHLNGGKHTCVEKDVEIVPMEKIVTVLPSDTFGISKLLPDYRVETTFRKVNEHVTEVTISHYYSTPSLKAWIFNLIGKRKIARETDATLNSIKAQIERGVSPMRPEAFSKRAHRLAQVGICVQFLALVRTLAEFFRLQHVQGKTLQVATVAPYVGAGLLAAVLTWAAVLCYFAGRDHAALGVAGVTILALVIIKIVIIAS
jgi:uncharacterized membrane protein